MKTFLKNNLLYLTVFLTGACVLVVEIVAVRILSPYFGNTIFTVSSVISIILAALSLGYYIGGTLADRYPSLKLFFIIILASGLSVLLLQILVAMVLPVLGYTLSLSTGPLVAALFLFFVPGFLLGMLSPYAIVLQKKYFSDAGIGNISGRMFFWSTLGSIGGSLSAGFVLVPFFGVSSILIGVGVLLCVLGFVPLAVLGLHKEASRKFLALSLMFVISAGISVPISHSDAIFLKDGVYERLAIYEGEYDGKQAYFFQQDRSNSGASFVDSDDLVYEYTKYYALYKIFVPDADRVLVIGGGAYSLPKAYAQDLPDARVDVSEIEPSLFELAQKYFRLRDTSRIHNSTEDGRRFLYDSDGQYDVIFSDVYHSLFSVPSHFTSKEFFDLAKSKLSKDGILIANIIGTLAPESPSFTLSEMKTFQSVFPNSYFFAVGSPKINIMQNLIFVGVNGDVRPDFAALQERFGDDEILSGLSDHRIDESKIDFTPHVIFTDDYAPVEYFASRGFDKALINKVE